MCSLLPSRLPRQLGRHVPLSRATSVARGNDVRKKILAVSGLEKPMPMHRPDTVCVASFREQTPAVAYLLLSQFALHVLCVSKTKKRDPSDVLGVDSAVAPFSRMVE